MGFGLPPKPPYFVKNSPSKRELSRRQEEKDMFILIGGAVVGLVGGLVVGVLKHRSLLFMQAGGVAGFGLGGLGFLFRAGWRKWRTGGSRQ
jgi:hypothetical protein